MYMKYKREHKEKGNEKEKTKNWGDKFLRIMINIIKI